MKKTETLHTCPDCGQPGFLPRGLAAHRKTKHCRDQQAANSQATKALTVAAGRPITLDDLEVLPPVKRSAKPGTPMPLAEIEDHIRALDARIEDRTRGYHNEVIYDIVGKGLMLLKAREHHLLQASTQFQPGNKKAALKNGVATVSTPSAKQLAKIEESAGTGFLAWIGERFPAQSSRTARNYMNAARNAFLTSDHSLADVEALRQTAALHEKKPTDLYRLADQDETPAPADTTPPPNLVQETTVALFDALDGMITLRDDMSGDEFEACHTRLLESLQRFTGKTWVPLDEHPGAEGQHGQMATATPKAKAKRRVVKAAKQKWKGAASYYGAPKPTKAAATAQRALKRKGAK